MTTLQSSDSQQVTSTDSTIEFRVSRPGLPRRRLKLVGSRYTIGSGVECSVRLDDASVRPTHAVLVKESQQVRLRAFGAPIVVNGRPVAESAIYVGDRFQIGTYEFELSYGPVASRPESLKQVDNHSKADRPVDALPASAGVTPEQLRRDIASENGGQEGKAASQEQKVVPRRRVSFASQMQVVDPNDRPINPAEADALSESVASSTADVVEGESEPAADVKADVQGSSQGNAAQLRDSECVVSAAVETITDIREAATPVSRTVDSAVKPAATELFDQYRAILANERRWQERSKKQLERFRQREQRSAAQIELLKNAQEAAERRARGAEDAVQSLRQQVTELAGRVAAVTSTVMPGLEQRLTQQYEESVVANRQYQSLMDGLRGRLDFLQSAITEVQADTEEIRQQTVANREDQQECAASTDTLEQALQKMAEDYQAERADAEAKVEELRQSLYQTSLKLSDLTGQLDETRQNGHGLGALVQQLRNSLQNAQTEAQRFATFEQIDEAMRLLKANDHRISQLTEEYDSQSSQLQQECEALRRRLEDSEHLANKAIAAATDALNEALEQRHLLESVAETTRQKALQQSSASVDDSSAAVDDEVSVAAAIQQPRSVIDAPESVASESVASESIEADRPDVQPEEYGTNESYDALRSQADVGEVSWIDADEPDASDDESPSLSQSAFHLPLEIDSEFSDAESDENSRAGSLPFASEHQESMDSAEDNGDQSHQEQTDFSGVLGAVGQQLVQAEDEDEVYAGVTYQYDPSQDQSFGTFRYENAERPESDDLAAPQPSTLESPAEAAEAAEELPYQATAFIDSNYIAEVAQLEKTYSQDTHQDAVGGLEPTLAVEPGLSNPSDSSVNTRPRTAAEVLASMGINIDDSAEAELEMGDSQVVAASSDFPNHGAFLDSEVRDSGDKNLGERGASAGADSELSDSSSHSLDGVAEQQEDEEDSIEAYMNRLLQRVQGKSETELPAPAPQPKAQIVQPVREPAPITKVSEETQSVSVSESALLDSPYVPRSQAPERSASLAAMRELANSSARTAIATSARRKMSNEVLFKYGLFGMGLLAGGAVLVGTRFEFGPWMVIGICCFGLAGFFLIEGTNLRRQLQEAAAAGDGSPEAESVG